MQKILGLFLITLTGLGFMVYSSSHSQARAGISLPYTVPADTQMAGLVQAYDRYFAQSVSAGQSAPGAAVVIVKDGEIVFSRGYGVCKAGGSDSVDVHTVFRIGSLSKGFASILSARLVQEGVFGWNDRVQQYFPEFQLRDRAQASRVNLSHVLSHTTGLPYHAYTNLVEAGKSVRQINEYFPQAPLAAKEGVLYTYQNAVYSVVQEMMLNATGKSYQELLEEKIFQPAGMKHASVRYEDIMAESNKAIPHRQTRAGWSPVSISNKYYNAAPAGGVNASISDMGAWLQLLLGGKPDIIADSTLTEVFSPRVRSENERRFFRNWPGPKTSWYALGWRVIQHGDDTIVFHGGYVNDFKSEIAFDRERGIGICVLFNGPAPLAKECVPAFFDLCDQFYPDATAQKR
jgi:beta-lactamase class C